MNGFNISVDNLVEALDDWLINQGIDINSDRTNKNIDKLEKRISDISCMDNRLKSSLCNEIQNTVDTAVTDAFNSGIKTGMGIIRNILNNTTGIY
ncbi:MAG: hypothetical protein K2J08_02640 [Ruminococcus sp.]|nr:hypothetical protein [Ruminococcus sp.]